MIQNIFQNFIREIQTLTMDEIYSEYKKELAVNPALDNYIFLIGVNEDSILKKFDFSTLLKENLYDNLKKDREKMYVVTPITDYNDFICLTPYLSNLKMDFSIFIDQNSMGIFDNFVKNNGIIKDDFIKFCLKYNIKHNHGIDLNYICYILEDYINPNHPNPNLYIAKEKIKNFEIFNNLDIKYYCKTYNTRFDTKLLLDNFDSFESYMENKFNFWNNFKSSEKSIQFLINYNFIYAFILNIIIEKNKTNSVEEKILNIYNNMVNTGRIFLEMLVFAYVYFTEPNKVEEFFIYDASWNKDRIIKKSRNMAWDIFMYNTSTYFIAHHDNKEANFGLPFLLSKDRKFKNSYIDNIKRKCFIINKNTRAFNTLLDQNDLSVQSVQKILAAKINKERPSIDLNFENLKQLSDNLIQKFEKEF